MGYAFIIDADERGEFAAHVEDSDGVIVADWTKSDCEDSSGFPPIVDGFMRDIRDMSGLSEFLGVNSIKYIG